MQNANIRPALVQDVSFILEMIKELALYEKEPQEVTITIEQLQKDGFGKTPLFSCIILES
ncbi:MAG: GNAT family N-acetyltransferase, partial [Bdellovibrionaceae bacterium]|nr:GNAT family N-acetyltransferase [Pseudobdellovibrionaceae bacterium]